MPDAAEEVFSRSSYSPAGTMPGATSSVRAGGAGRRVGVEIASLDRTASADENPGGTKLSPSGLTRGLYRASNVSWLVSGVAPGTRSILHTTVSASMTAAARHAGVARARTEREVLR